MDSKNAIDEINFNDITGGHESKRPALSGLRHNVANHNAVAGTWEERKGDAGVNWNKPESEKTQNCTVNNYKQNKKYTGNIIYITVFLVKNEINFQPTRESAVCDQRHRLT